MSAIILGINVICATMDCYTGLIVNFPKNYIEKKLVFLKFGLFLC